MPLLRKGVLIPHKGVDFSQPSTFIDDRGGFPQNMRYYKGEMRKRPGATLVGGQEPDGGNPILGLAKLETIQLVKYVLRTTKAKLQVFNTSTLVWDTISVSDFTGTNDDFFDFTNVTESEFLIVTNYVDAIRKWPGSGNDSALGGTPPKAKTCTYLSPYILLGYTNDGSNVEPWKVQWNDTNLPETWSGGNSGSALLSDEPSPIQKLLKLNEFVAAYKRDSLWLGRKVETSDIFIFDNVKTGIGLASPRAVVDADGKHFFMGVNDFYVWNGIREESIGAPVRDEVFETINRNQMNRHFAIHVQEQNEVWWYIVPAGGSWPTQIWKYNYKLGWWYFDTCPSYTAAVKWQRVSSLSWNDDSGDWDSAQDKWDDGVTTQDWEEIMMSDLDGYSYKLDYSVVNDNGAAVSAHFISKDFVADQLEFNKRWLQLDVWAKGTGQLLVDYSIDHGDTWVNIPWNSSQTYIDLPATYNKYRIYFDVVSKHIRFRFRNARTGETFYLRNFYPYYLVQDDHGDYRA